MICNYFHTVSITNNFFFKSFTDIHQQKTWVATFWVVRLFFLHHNGMKFLFSIVIFVPTRKRQKHSCRKHEDPKTKKTFLHILLPEKSLRSILVFSTNDGHAHFHIFPFPFPPKFVNFPLPKHLFGVAPAFNVGKQKGETFSHLIVIEIRSPVHPYTITHLVKRSKAILYSLLGKVVSFTCKVYFNNFAPMNLFIHTEEHCKEKRENGKQQIYDKFVWNKSDTHSVGSFFDK